MKVLYEGENIIIKQLDDGIYAGYKRCKLYKVGGLPWPEEFTDEPGKWILTYKKGTKIFTDYGRENTGVYSGVWIEGDWYHDRRVGQYENNRYESDKGKVVREAWLKQVNEDGDLLIGFLLGFQKETPTE